MKEFRDGSLRHNPQDGETQTEKKKERIKRFSVGGNNEIMKLRKMMR